MYDEVEKVLKDYEQGTRPTQEKVREWNSAQILSFLQELPHKIPVGDCRYFEDVFELEKRNDPSYYSFFYPICITSGYMEVMPRVETYIDKIGRMIYVVPIIRALMESGETRSQVRSMFEKVRGHHHQITIAAMDGALKKAGL